MRDTAYFMVGAAVPIVAHEAGHQARGGSQLEWDRGSWKCTRECNNSSIAAAGFITEAAISEAVARAFNSPDHRPFRLGVRTSAGVHMLRYAIRNDKDFENFSPSTRRRARLLTAAAGVLNLVQINIDF